MNLHTGARGLLGSTSLCVVVSHDLTALVRDDAEAAAVAAMEPAHLSVALTARPAWSKGSKMGRCAGPRSRLGVMRTSPNGTPRGIGANFVGGVRGQRDNPMHTSVASGSRVND